jgi:2-succinyl-6-hydroxy-2,4-cyclohexadiene-1-carboxylate synthase
LLLHGFTGCHSDWIGVWPAEHPALALDVPGHGQSPDPSGNFNQEIHRLLAALPAGIQCLAGYSLGGRLALALMAAAPGRFGKLLILSAHPGLNAAGERAERRQRDQVWIDRVRRDGIQRFAAAWQRQPLFRQQHRSAPRAVAIQHHRRLRQRPEGLARALDCFGLGQMPPTWSAIRDYNGDLHWISGARDAKFLALGEQVCQIRPATTHHILPECGHNPLLEAPRMLKTRLRLAAS